jgi:hypothetical protein
VKFAVSNLVVDRNVYELIMDRIGAGASVRGFDGTRRAVCEDSLLTSSVPIVLTPVVRIIAARSGLTISTKLRTRVLARGRLVACQRGSNQSTGCSH